MNKETIYIAFYNPETKKIEPEYIPSDSSRFGMWFRSKVTFTYRRLNIPVYYWNLRHLLDFETRKIEDLLFLIHVIEEHSDKLPLGRERYVYNKLYFLYRSEIENFVLPYIIEKKNRDPIIHPYYLAYKKRWLRPKYSQARRFYHGMHEYELFEMYSSLIQRVSEEGKKNLSKKRYYKKLLMNNKN